MNDPLRLSPTPPARLSLNYGLLREKGLELIRQYAGESWTDHNVHDPGITLLEAFCYAMTELGFRIQQELPDLLRSGEVYAPPELIPAHQTLLTAPITLADLLRVLLDHPLVQEAQISLAAPNLVSFYQSSEAAIAAGEAPFTYAVTPKTVTLKGLYDVLVAFTNPDWNSNTYPLTVSVGAQSYRLEVALPYWDDPEAAPFRAGLVNTIDAVAMQPLGTDVWRNLNEAQSYFGRVQVSYNGGDSVAMWVILRIIDDLAQRTTDTPGILEAARISMEITGPDSLIQQFSQRVQDAHSGALQVQHYVESWRNLGEVPVRLQVARQQEIGIRSRIEVTGGANLEQRLADIFLAIDLALTPPITFYTLEQRRQQGATPETLYDGPLLGHGFLAEDSAESIARSGTLYTSDILRLIMQWRSGSGTDLVAQENPTGRDIVAVTDLALSTFVNNRPITTDAQDCLRLVDTQRYRPRLSLAKSRITFVRNDLEVSYSLAQAEDLITQGRQQQGATRLASFSPVWPVPLGEALPINDYFPLQNDLPRIYGVGETGRLASADPTVRARSLQLKGYLLLFEQFLADMTAQLSHLNQLFSADPDIATTYFTRPLFELPGTEQLLKDFPRQAGETWASYQADLNNPYRQALQAAAESPTQFLDRRNRMLDHLLARQGEDMVTWAQELHRWAQKELTEALGDGMLSPEQRLTALETRRQQVNARLIQDKANFLAAAPVLNASRLQSCGQPLRRFPERLRIEPTGSTFAWQITLDSGVRLQSRDGTATQAAALMAAEAAAILAAQPSFYRIVSAGSGRWRYQVTAATSETTNARVLAESVLTWSSESTAETARDEAVSRFATLRLETSLASMERRIAYLTGIRRQLRQPLIVSLDEYFEIYDEVDDDDIIEKRWRLWERPNQSGAVLLSSVFHFSAEDEADAIAEAQASIQQAIRYGLDRWNYQISPAGDASFNLELRHPNSTLLGLRSAPVDSEAQVAARITQTLNHLYGLYSAEGFHTIEHILLRPQLEPDPADPEASGDDFLILPSPKPSSGWEPDPYSHRLSLVFPSGYGQNFAAEGGDSTVRRAVRPHRFRDLEFRRHMERIVQQACPAHLHPTLYWVDRQDPELATEFPALTPDTSTALSFDQFETIYFTWLNTHLIPGAEAGAIASARNQLILALNALARQSSRT